MSTFQIGDPVVYRKDKVSTHPGPGAEEIHLSEHGDDYSYTVPKYWTIIELPDPGHVVVVTRTGKHLTLSTDDPHLHKATLLERLRFRGRFPHLA